MCQSSLLSVDTQSGSEIVNVFFTGCESQQEAESQSEQQLSADTYYKYEELHSKPYITPSSEIPENLLHVSYPL